MRLVILMGAVLVAPSASAQPTDADNPFRASPDCFVYFSDGGDGFYDFTRVLPAGPRSLELRVTAGSTSDPEPSCEPGSPTGTGDLCVVSFVIEKTGGGSLDSFVFETGINGAAAVSPSRDTLTVNISAATNPLPGGFAPSLPRVIGTLNLTMAGDTVVNLTSGSCIALGNEERGMVSHTMFVPEPGEHLLLLAGLLGLAALYWLRQRREGDRLASRR